MMSPNASSPKTGFQAFFTGRPTYVMIVGGLLAGWVLYSLVVTAFKYGPRHGFNSDVAADVHHFRHEMEHNLLGHEDESMKNYMFHVAKVKPKNISPQEQYIADQFLKWKQQQDEEKKAKSEKRKKKLLPSAVAAADAANGEDEETAAVGEEEASEGEQQQQQPQQQQSTIVVMDGHNMHHTFVEPGLTDHSAAAVQPVEIVASNDEGQVVIEEALLTPEGHVVADEAILVEAGMTQARL